MLDETEIKTGEGNIRSRDIFPAFVWVWAWFSPSKEAMRHVWSQVLASCSVDGTVRLWDVRDAKTPEKIKWQADVVDINVISWNECAPLQPPPG